MRRKQIKRLSATLVRSDLAPGRYPDGDNLYLQVGDTRKKAWLLRYQLNGTERWMGLGPAGVISLAEARDRAAAARKLLVDGIDPLEHRDVLRAQQRLQQANALSFAQCAGQYIAAHRAGWRNPKHVEQWTNTIATYACPVIGALPVQEVDTPHLLRILEPIWTEKHETASRLRGRIEHVLDWARVRGHRTGENPARWKGHLQKLLAKVKRKDRVEHHPALPYDEISAFMVDVRAQPGTAARALEFTILTAARTGEVIRAKLEEFDLEKALWIVPAARMKAGDEHRVPLSPRAVELVKAQREGAYVFGGRYEAKPLSNMSMLEVVRGMGRKDLTVHGFRSTFRDWAAECTNYERALCEKALAHLVGDETERSYQRGDLLEKRRRLMADWAKYCDTPKRGGKVLPIRRKA